MGLAVPEEPSWRPPRGEIAAFAALALLACLSLSGALRPLRWLCFLFSAAVLGYWTGTWLSTETAAKILLWRLPSLSEHTLWYLLLLLALPAALFWKNV